MTEYIGRLQLVIALIVVFVAFCLTLDKETANVGAPFEFYEKIRTQNSDCMKWLGYAANYPVWRIATIAAIPIAFLITFASLCIWYDAKLPIDQTFGRFGLTLLVSSFLVQRATQGVIHYFIWHIMCLGFGCSACGVDRTQNYKVICDDSNDNSKIP